MSREYIFRGKDKKTGKWIYGSLLKFHGFQIFDYTLNAWVSVDGHTIGQYTGVSDDRGNMIFEDDFVANRSISNSDHEGYGLVRYHQGSYYVELSENNWLPLSIIHRYWSEVIIVDEGD